MTGQVQEEQVMVSVHSPRKTLNNVLEGIDRSFRLRQAAVVDERHDVSRCLQAFLQSSPNYFYLALEDVFTSVAADHNGVHVDDSWTLRRQSLNLCQDAFRG